MDDLPVATLRPTGTGTPTPIAIYYVHADQLGTPRAITRPSDDAIVWKWDNAEPFGNNAANDNPSGLGTFSFNLRFPGQQYDGDTGTHYNYFRDYDPLTGRYAQSDPIGLGSGTDTYGYASASPIKLVDALGLNFGPPIEGGKPWPYFRPIDQRTCGEPDWGCWAICAAKAQSACLPIGVGFGIIAGAVTAAFCPTAGLPTGGWVGRGIATLCAFTVAQKCRSEFCPAPMRCGL